MNSFLLTTKTIPSLIKFDLLIASQVAEFDGIVTGEEGVRILLKSPVTQAIIDQIEAIVPPPAQSNTEYAQGIVKQAQSFASQIVVEFAAENILMGITQAGKTKVVADYLADVTRYAQTGSLYEVINEITRLINSGIPADLSPFVTQVRLEAFRQKIINYLTGG